MSVIPINLAGDCCNASRDRHKRLWRRWRTALDPDQEVQGAVRTVFELFERESSAYAVVRLPGTRPSLSASVVWLLSGIWMLPDWNMIEAVAIAGLVIMCTLVSFFILFGRSRI
jgi:hypothetical protein